MSTITVGIPTTASSAAGVGVGASSGGYKTFICFSNPCNGNGLLSTLAAHIHNDTGSPVSARFITYACTDLGGGNYQITQRARTGAYSIAKGTDGLTAIYSQSLEVHKTDVIGLQIYFPTGSYDFEDVFTVYGGDGYTPRYYTIVTGTFTSKTVNAGVSDPFIIYGSGDSYSGEEGGGGGGIGGDPKSACHDVTESVEQNGISTGLWGVVRPRDFGVSGGESAAYVDLTFPWDTAGTYHSDEVFIDGVTKSYTRANNPLERYTLKMDVLRYTGDRPDITISNGEFETNDTWTGSGSGEYSSAYVGGVAHSGSRSRVLALGDTTDSTVGFSSGDYAAVSQTISAMQDGTVYFYWRWGYSNISVTSGTSVVEVLLDGVVVWDEVINDYGAANTWYAASIAVSEGDHTLTFRHRATSTKVPGILFVWIDSVESSTSNVPTGRVYNFHECWWMESSNGDVYVAPATGNNSNLGFSWDEAYATLQKGLDVVGKGGVVHVKCHTTVHQVSNISDSKIIKPYTEGSYNKIYITK